jgi:hypothetical protein
MNDLRFIITASARLSGNFLFVFLQKSLGLFPGDQPGYVFVAGHVRLPIRLISSPDVQMRMLSKGPILHCLTRPARPILPLSPTVSGA